MYKSDEAVLEFSFALRQICNYYRLKTNPTDQSATEAPAIFQAIQDNYNQDAFELAITFLLENNNLIREQDEYKFVLALPTIQENLEILCNRFFKKYSKARGIFESCAKLQAERKGHYETLWSSKAQQFSI